MKSLKPQASSLKPQASSLKQVKLPNNCVRLAGFRFGASLNLPSVFLFLLSLSVPASSLSPGTYCFPWGEPDDELFLCDQPEGEVEEIVVKGTRDATPKGWIVLTENPFDGLQEVMRLVLLVQHRLGNSVGKPKHLTEINSSYTFVYKRVVESIDEYEAFN